MDQKRLRELALEGLQAQKQRIELEIRALTKAVGAFASTITVLLASIVGKIGINH
jgi:hypothetical protein